MNTWGYRQRSIKVADGIKVANQLTEVGRVLGYPGGLSVTPRVLKCGTGRRERTRRVGCEEIWPSVAGLEMEEGTVNGVVQAVPRSWKRRGKGFSRRASKKERSPAHTLVLVR